MRIYPLSQEESKPVNEKNCLRVLQCSVCNKIMVRNPYPEYIIEKKKDMIYQTYCSICRDERMAVSLGLEFRNA